MDCSADKLIFRPELASGRPGVVKCVTAKDADWEFLSCEICRLGAGESWTHETGGCETALALLTGTCSVRSSRGEWEHLVGRRDVFDGGADSPSCLRAATSS